MLDDRQIFEIAQYLDEAVPRPQQTEVPDKEKYPPASLVRNEPKVYISLMTRDKYGEELGPYAPIRILANRNGYLCLALECLRAAIEPTISPATRHLPLKWDYLLAKDSVRISSVERSEEGVEYPDVPEPPKTKLERVKDAFMGLLGIALVLFLIACFFVGFWTILKSLP